MKFVNGTITYDDVYELTYNLLANMGILVRQDGTMIDDDYGNIISFEGKILKATVNEKHINYAGQGEEMLDILGNIKHMTSLFGYFIDKKQKLDNMGFISYYTEEQETAKGDKRSNLVLKYGIKSTDIISTDYYFNKCLKFIAMIFKIEGSPVDLIPFDEVEPRRGIVNPLRFGGRR